MSVDAGEYRHGRRSRWHVHVIDVHFDGWPITGLSDGLPTPRSNGARDSIDGRRGVLAQRQPGTAHPQRPRLPHRHRLLLQCRPEQAYLIPLGGSR
jgi:hypothetical protein